MDRIGDLPLINFISNSKSLISEEETVEIIDLGLHGFADSFFRQDQRELAGHSAPLVCLLDQRTGLVQLKNLTESDSRYRGIDYSYTSSNSQYAMSHWNDYISYVSRIKEIKGSRILEVGSNDGYLLSRVRQFSQNILGVDASPYMGSIASQSGVPTIVGTFGESQDLKSSISDYYSEYDFIFANNVLNHSNNPLKFINLISDLLAKDGCFVFEVPYWLETILSLHFDQIYHEHITYWTVKSSEFLLASAGLFIQDVNLVDYHGGSLRIVASKNPNKKSKKIESFIDRENRALLLEVETYINYVREIDLKKKVFLDHLMQYKQQGKLVFGVGAAAKANTLLTYYGISAEDMKFILDSSPHKQGKITPVSMIPIVGDSHVVEIRNGIGVVLAWNLSNKLKDYLLTLNSELEFLEL